MKSSVLRVGFAAPFDVDSFIKANHTLHPDAVWRAGEAHWRSGTFRDSGFNRSIAEDSDWAHLLSRTCERLVEMKQVLARAVDAGARIEIDFGLTVGGPGAFTASAAFDPTALRLFADMGAGVKVSAYPSSDVSESESTDTKSSRSAN